MLHLNSIWQTLYQTIGPVADELYQVGSTMVGKHLAFWGEKGMLQVGNKHSRKGLGKIHIGELWVFPLFLIFFCFFGRGGGVMLQQTTKRTILWRWVKDVSYSHWGWVIQTCDGRTSQYFLVCRFILWNVLLLQTYVVHVHCRLGEDDMVHQCIFETHMQARKYNHVPMCI